MQAEQTPLDSGLKSYLWQSYHQVGELVCKYEYSNLPFAGLQEISLHVFLQLNITQHSAIIQKVNKTGENYLCGVLSRFSGPP